MSELLPYFRSIVEQDRASVVICSLSHEILYMNPAAVRNYARRGGSELVGRNLKDCHNERSRERIDRVIDWFAASPEHNLVYTGHREKDNKDIYMVALRDESGRLIGYYEKHEYRSPESMPLYDMP